MKKNALKFTTALAATSTLALVTVASASTRDLMADLQVCSEQVVQNSSTTPDTQQFGRTSKSGAFMYRSFAGNYSSQFRSFEIGLDIDRKQTNMHFISEDDKAGLVKTAKVDLGGFHNIKTKSGVGMVSSKAKQADMDRADRYTDSLMRATSRCMRSKGYSNFKPSFD